MIRALATSALLLLAASIHVGCGAAPPAGPRTVEISVTTKGFEPSPIAVKVGEPLQLVVTRKTDTTCATSIVVPGYDIDQALPLNQPVTIQLTPKKTGELRYGCGMGQMIAGVLTVE
ncbi:cupredoxin domain-containing protein [Myxococcota bacterium]|nr:cupredoxin domain-containing protein [Myxococcota bacterium]